MVTLLKSSGDGDVCENDDEGEPKLQSRSPSRKYLSHRSKSLTLQSIRLIQTPGTIPFTTASNDSFSSPWK